MVAIVTRERLALWGVIGMPAFLAISTTFNVLQMPPIYITSGCNTSTACISIILCHVTRSQSCSPPVTSMFNASVTCLVSSSSQYLQGSSKWLMPSASSSAPTSMARLGEKPLLPSTNLAMPSPSARATTGTTSSVRPGHSSMSFPHSAPTRHLNASKPNSSRSFTNRWASSCGVMSRRIEDAYVRSFLAVPPRSSTTGLPSTLPRRSHSAVSKPAFARAR